MNQAENLQFVQHECHRQLVRRALETALGQGAVAALLCGSVARRPARPGSDLDPRFYWAQARPFRASGHTGILVEQHGQTLAQAALQLGRADQHLDMWAEARLLRDPDGELSRLRQQALTVPGGYRTPAAEKRALRHWLSTALVKLGLVTDELQASFLINTILWKLAERLCAANNRPTPPSTLMWALLPTLPSQPHGKQPHGWLKPLLTGEIDTRRKAFRQVCDWVVSTLADPDVPISET